MIANYAHELRPEDYYMSRVISGEEDEEGNPLPDRTVWDVEVKLEEGYPAGTAVLWRRAKWITQPYVPAPDPDDPITGEIPEESVAGYQYVQASPDTIAVYSGEFEYTVTAIYQQWVHAEVWNETFQYWERPQPTTKYSQAFYDPNDPTRLMGVEYVADFTLGYQLRTVIDYNWFSGNVNKHTYSFYAPGVKKRIYTQLQIYDPNRFNMDLSDFDGPYEVIEQAGLTNIIYYPDGVTEDECLVDPYLGVDEQDDEISVFMDGVTAVVRFDESGSSADHIRFLVDNNEIAKSRCYFRSAGSRGWHYAVANPVVTILERGPNVVVIHAFSNIVNSSGVPLTNSKSVDVYYTFYDDTFTQFVKWVIEGGTAEIDEYSRYNGALGTHDVDGTGVEIIYEDNSAEAVGAATEVERPLADFVGSRSAELNVSLTLLYDSTGLIEKWSQGTSTTGGAIGFNDTIIPEGTHNWAIAMVLDSKSRANDGGTFKAWAAGTTYAKDEIVLYNNIRYISRQDGNIGNTPPATGGSSAWWLEYRINLGIQYNDFVLTNLEDIVNDLNLPLSIDAGGFASDGAFHSEPRAADGKSVLTYDQDRIKPKHVLHDFPFQYGDVESPTDILLSYLKCDENQSSSDLFDSSGNGQDGTWSNVSGGSARNTNTPGDSVVQGGRGRSLDTQGGVAYIEMAAGSGSLHNNDFLKKGCAMVSMTPQFDNPATESYILEVFQAGSDYIRFFIQTGGTIRLRINWGGTAVNAETGSLSGKYNKETIFLPFWDSDQNIFGIIVDGKPISIREHTGNPTTSSPSAFTIAKRASGSSPMDTIIHSIKTFSEPILPYGSIFTGNGTVDPAVAHADITMHSVNGTSADIGGNISDIGNIDNQKGSVSLWCDAVTGDVWSAGTQFKVEYTGTVFRFTYGGSTVDSQAVSGTDHYVRAGWDQNEQIYIVVDGIRNSGNAGSAPTLAGSITWNGTINRRKLYITSESGTPENWTANGNPLHIPLVDAL